MKRIIPYKDKHRVETGATQFGDDWCGLFVRGDDCLYLICILKYILKKKKYIIGRLWIKNFVETLLTEINKNVLHNPEY